MRDAVEAVASITKARHDVALFVEFLVECTKHNLHIFTSNVCFNRGKTLGRTKQANASYIGGVRCTWCGSLAS